MRLFVIILVLVSLSLSRSDFLENEQRDVSYSKQINKLLKKLDEQYYHEEQEFKYFPPQFYQKKGLYSSYIHGNAMDKENGYLYHLVRQYIGCPDSNMFVSNFVLSALLDCAEFGTIQIDQDLFEQTIDTILEFRDKNQKEGIPSYSFWLQKLKNETWYSSPINLENIANSMKYMPEWVKTILAKMGLNFVAMSNLIIDAFHLPPDADDSSVNIALGYRIMNSPFIRQSIKDKWIRNNYDVNGYFNLLKKYSYKPFDTSNSSLNTIDIRTYFGFNEYLSQLNRTENFQLFTTWIMSTDDQIEKLVAIPSNVNNFDCSVLSNTLFGLHHALLYSNQTEFEKIFDQELQGLYLNSTDIINYAINSEIALRHPDIAFFYYPSVYDFYWFVARNVHLLNSNKQKIQHSLIKQVADSLNESMKNKGTKFLLNNAKLDKNGNIYWEEFLGVYNNKTYNEDTTFSTVMTLNALLDTWTVSISHQNGTISRIFDPQTPKNVTNTIQKGIQTLLKDNSFSKSNQNAFFSGSFKSVNTWFYYPMNVNYYLNGTVFDPHNPPVVLNEQVAAVRGIYNQSEYQELLQQKWFGFKPIEEFLGYNYESFSYPYWSSPSITLSMGMSLLSKYQSIHLD
ncbi:hypothetical protein TTHERM_00985180 (macronuclear) [Tetrahymena thermophila SB210]|uniref:Transmembrane protein n=1 Tax=Tetrahymena thermophila (strain SB210) TaxID=312017 RepID=Q233W0_TETTS|nr:hypothetical protein TTHERM_00985180 [Tetrahymena thermophila SB210]EAR91824.2 hypothetical protein TTHERM_00985180 [Tetrahymena thermophila SB210]|eukprot:XP_001012069.2 hypothetical protein TTHERM_00985180 [Tetrahymena thermophila SB210]